MTFSHSTDNSVVAISYLIGYILSDMEGAKAVIIVKHIVEISGVVAAVILHEGRGLHELYQLGVDFAWVELIPGNLVEGPMRHLGPMLPSIGLRPAGNGWGNPFRLASSP